MTHFETAYDTTACSGFRTKDTQDKLEEGMIAGALRKVMVKTNHNQEGAALYLLEGGNSFADAIPYFNHPMPVPTGKGSKEVCLAVDIRPFGKYNTPNAVFVVRNKAEYDWSLKRAVLNYVWLTERKELLRDISSIPMQVYATLLSDAIARRFALDNGERVKIQVLAAYFYYGLFGDSHQGDELGRDKMVSAIGRAVPVGNEMIYDWLEDLGPVNDLSEFCKAAQHITNSVALQDFNLRTLIATIAGTWFGTNSRETIVVALEHVPTWIMAVAASLDEATFKRSSLAKISERFSRNNAASNFLKSLNTLIGQDIVGQLERGLAMEGFSQVIGNLGKMVKDTFSNNESKDKHKLVQSNGSLNFEEEGKSVFEAVQTALDKTYNRPDWRETTLKGTENVAKNAMLGYLYNGQQQVKITDIARDYEKAFQSLERLISVDKPNQAARWTVFNSATDMDKSGDLAEKMGELYEKHSELLNSPISDRIQPSVAKMKLSGMQGEFLVKNNNHDNFCFNNYLGDGENFGYPGVTSTNAQDYVDALQDLLKLQQKLLKCLSTNRDSISLPYFEQLPEEFWKNEDLHTCRYFDLYCNNVTCTQTREEVKDFLWCYEITLSNAIKAVYYLLFNA